MRRIATALGLLLLMSGPAFAQKEFEPTAAERRTIGDCIDKTAGDSELEQMSKCIGLVADPCPNAPNSNTFTIVAYNMREQKIWDERLNDWYGQAQARSSRMTPQQLAQSRTRNAPGFSSATRNAVLGEALRGRHFCLSRGRQLHTDRDWGARSRCAPSSMTSIISKTSNPNSHNCAARRIAIQPACCQSTSVLIGSFPSPCLDARILFRGGCDT